MYVCMYVYMYIKFKWCFPLFFFNLLTLLRLSMAKSKISLGKCHTALENVWVIFKYLLILISNIIILKEETEQALS